MTSGAAARYRLGERIATGGMAEVYRAILVGAEGFERDVVVKRIRSEFARDASFRTMFINEARVMASLSHRNIVQVYDFGYIDDALYLSVEPVDGTNLRRALAEQVARGRPLPAPLAAFVIAEVLRGLDYAHRKTDKGGAPLGIVHRDISPENVLLSWDGEVKVSDFGIAKSRGSARQTEPGAVKGKLLYLAPELLAGRPADARTDVYATGLVLYEMVAGTHPLEKETDAVVVARLAAGDMPQITEAQPSTPPALVRVIERALARLPEFRYQSAGEMSRDLDDFARAVGVTTSSDGVATWLAALFPMRTDNVERRSARTTSNPFSGELVEATKRVARSADTVATSLLGLGAAAPPPADTGLGRRRRAAWWVAGVTAAAALGLSLLLLGRDDGSGVDPRRAPAAVPAPVTAPAPAGAPGSAPASAPAPVSAPATVSASATVPTTAPATTAALATTRRSRPATRPRRDAPLATATAPSQRPRAFLNVAALEAGEPLQGVVVVVNGEAAGVARPRIAVPPGRLKVEVRKAGFTAEPQWVTVGAGDEKDITFSLVPR